MTRHDMRWRIYAAKTFYFLSGFSFMTWASLIPFLKHTFQIPDDHLGILLLTLGIGALLMMVFAGTLAARFGCRRSMAASGIAISSCIIALSYMPYFYGAIAIVLSLGASLGLLAVVININGIKIERTLRTRIMSGLQALWSLGSFMGAFYFATLLHLGLSWYIVATSSALIILGLTLFFAPHLDGTTSSEQAHSTLFMPKGEIIVIGIICAIYFLIEGSIDDWSGIFLTSEKGLDISHSGIGITLFSAAIFLSRLPGDTIVNRFGAKTVLCTTLPIAMAGFLMLLLANPGLLLYVSFILIGVGCANTIPIFFSLLGKQRIMPVNEAVSAVSAIGYAGILLGPAILGFLGRAYSLYISYSFVTFLLLCVAIIAIKMITYYTES